MGEFCQDVARAADNRWSQKMQNWRKKTAGIMSGSDNTEGGYLVPTEFNTRLLQTQIELSVIEPKTQFVPMQTNTILFPAIVVSSHASHLFGGIVIYRTAEGHQKTKSKPAFGQIQLTLHNLVGLINVTNQLLEDSPISIEPIIFDLFGKAVVFTKEDDYINGTGVGQPVGVLNAPCLITQGKESGQAADTIVTDNILNMWTRLHPQSRKNAIWHINTDALSQIYRMTQAVGTGGTTTYMPANGVSGNPFETLMGRPMIDTEHCRTLGDKGDLILADWSQYLVGGKSGRGIRTASSSHLRFDYNEMVFRIEMRYDGRPWWNSALTPKRSTTTLSPFITLEART